MNFTMQNANGSIEEPLALLAFRQNQPYRTVVRLRIDFDEISLRFSQPALPDMILFLRSLSIRESNPIWFTQANFPQSCVKMLVNPSGLSALFPCLTKKFALWKLCDPAHRKIFVFLVRKGAARLTPCKTDNPKRRKFNKCRAYGIRLSNA